MPDEYTFSLNKSYYRESRTHFPGKREWQNHRNPGKSGLGNPGNETLVRAELLQEIGAIQKKPERIEVIREGSIDT
jgi:hypothetical protein